MVTRTEAAPSHDVARLAELELKAWNRYRMGGGGHGLNRRRLDRWWRIYRALERAREAAAIAAGLVLVAAFAFWWTVEALNRIASMY